MQSLSVPMKLAAKEISQRLYKELDRRGEQSPIRAFSATQEELHAFDHILKKCDKTKKSS